jgi:hypothetical protein
MISTYDVTCTLYNTQTQPVPVPRTVPSQNLIWYQSLLFHDLAADKKNSSPPLLISAAAAAKTSPAVAVVSLPLPPPTKTHQKHATYKLAVAAATNLQPSQSSCRRCLQTHKKPPTNLYPPPPLISAAAAINKP